MTSLYELSEQERTWVQDAAARRAAHGDQTLVFENRLLALNESWSNITLSNITFVKCSFAMNMMRGVTLVNVQFIDCDFGEIRWVHRHWDKVSFKDCYFDGEDVEISVHSGTKSLFEGCWFYGTKKKPQYLGQEEDHAPEQPCTIAGPGEARFIDCEFNRAWVTVGDSAHFERCKFSRVEIASRRKSTVHRLVMQNCTAEYKLIMSEQNIGEVKLKDCSFEGVILGATTGQLIELQNVSCSLGVEECKVEQIRITNTTFFNSIERSRGTIVWLNSTQAQLVELIDCKFPGAKPRIHCEPEKDGPNTFNAPPPAGPTRIETLRLRNTDLPRGNFNEAIIQNFELENLEARNLSFKKAHIGTLKLKNVTLNGTVDFTDGGHVDQVVQDDLQRGKSFKLLRDNKDAVAL